MNVLEIFKTQRPPERQRMVVPIHEQINQEPKRAEIQAVLMVAVKQVAGSGLIWKWDSFDGTGRLVRWDAEQEVFLRGSLSDWQIFFGRHWHVRDTAGQDYAGPSRLVTDRLIQVVLSHPATPIAGWALQLAKKREAAK